MSSSGARAILAKLLKLISGILTKTHEAVCVGFSVAQLQNVKKKASTNEGFGDLMMPDFASDLDPLIYMI